MYTDGASRSNPGPAAVGVSLHFPDGNEIDHLSELVGERTNNQAEYEAVRRGLEAAARYADRFESVEMRSDSQLLIRQMRGEYAVRNPDLAHLRDRVLEAQGPFGAVEYQWVRRENPGIIRADELANAALEGAGFPKAQPPWKRGR